MFEVVGIAGIAISVLAYVPQVVHLARERCSAGISIRAWLMWLVSSLLIGCVAVHRHDPVFILLQLSGMTSAAVILFFGHKYRGLVCDAHMHSLRERWLGDDIDRSAHPPDPTRPPGVRRDANIAHLRTRTGAESPRQMRS